MLFYSENMKAIIIGATGATGEELVNQLINDSTYTEIICLVRRKLNVHGSKIKEVIIDFDKLNDYKKYFSADVAFSCLGTTIKDAGSKEVQWKIDYEYQLKFAQLAKENNIETFVLISSIGANKNSKIFYSKMKGALDFEVKNLNFKKTIIFQPPSLIRPNSKRKGEIFGMKLIQFFNSIELFKNYKPLHVTDLAKAMIIATKQLPIGSYFISPKQIIKMTSNS